VTGVQRVAFAWPNRIARLMTMPEMPTLKVIIGDGWDFTPLAVDYDRLPGPCYVTDLTGATVERRPDWSCYLTTGTPRPWIVPDQVPYGYRPEYWMVADDLRRPIAFYQSDDVPAVDPDAKTLTIAPSPWWCAFMYPVLDEPVAGE